MILYIHGRGISPFEWLLKDGLGTQTSLCACSRGARCPSCRPGPLTALSPPKGPTCRHRRSAQADPGLKPRACRTRRRPASFPTTAPHATPGTGPPHREPGLSGALPAPGPPPGGDLPCRPCVSSGTACRGRGVSRRARRGLGRSASSVAMQTEAGRRHTVPGGRPSGRRPLPLRPAPPTPPASPVLGQGYGC